MTTTMGRLFSPLVLSLYIAFLALFGFGAIAASAQTDIFSDNCDPTTSSSTVCQEKNRTQTAKDNALYGPNGIILKITKIVAFAVGILAVIFIIIGGIKYITSYGDPAKLSSAKSTILYAIVGIIVTLVAQAMIVLVINRL